MGEMSYCQLIMQQQFVAIIVVAKKFTVKERKRKKHTEQKTSTVLCTSYEINCM